MDQVDNESASVKLTYIIFSIQVLLFVYNIYFVRTVDSINKLSYPSILDKNTPKYNIFHKIGFGLFLPPGAIYTTFGIFGTFMGILTLIPSMEQNTLASDFENFKDSLVLAVSSSVVGILFSILSRILHLSHSIRDGNIEGLSHFLNLYEKHLREILHQLSSRPDHECKTEVIKSNEEIEPACSALVPYRSPAETISIVITNNNNNANYNANAEPKVKILEIKDDRGI